ncbi:ATP-binding protein [Fontimonas sp. SYSU GA230001]
MDLFEQLSYYEGADVEYKSARGGLPASLWETYSAFANTAGGTIWLGVVQRDDGRLEVQGIEQPEKLRADLWNLLNNREKVSRNLLSERDVEVVPVGDARTSLIVIRVPRASRRERPVYVGKDPFAGSFRRNYEGDYRCSDVEVRRMFSDQSDEPADSRILDGFGWDDLHAESLRQFRNRMASLRPGHAWLAEDDRGLLSRLGGWRQDRSSGREGLTLAGLLMFGRESAIRDPAAVSGFHLDYRERYSDDPAVRWTDRLTLDGTWEGNVFQFHQLVTAKLSTGPGIKTPFRTDEHGYRKATTPVHEALQEALVNALIHADYSGQGGIVIDRYSDRLEFSNPGTLLVSREQLLRGGISECRNKSLQLMFQMLGAGDKAGSGIDKIRRSWAAEHWQSPSLIEQFRPDRVTLVLPMISTLPEAIMDRLSARFGPAFRQRSADEIQALVAAEVEGEITNQRLQNMLTLHRVDITRLLGGLVRDGFLIQDGHGRWTRYFPRSEGDISPDKAPVSPDKAPVSPDKALVSPDKAPIPPGNDVPDERTADTIGAAADPELLAIAAPVRQTGRSSPEDVRRVILDLCRQRYLTLRELARLLDRSEGLVRDSYVSPMLRDQLLELRYPDKRTHRDQAYRTRSGSPGGTST